MFSWLIKRTLQLPRATKRALAMSMDMLLAILTVLFGYYLRLGYWTLPIDIGWVSVVAAMALSLPIFTYFGLYRTIFRYAGWHSLVNVARATAVYASIYSALFTLYGVQNVPRTVGIIQPILLFLVIGASRAFARFYFGGGMAAILKAADYHRIMIYGAGSAGRQLAAALASSDNMVVLGFIDDDPTLQGAVINGKRIYSAANLSDLFRRLAVDDVLLALPSARLKRRNEIIDLIKNTSVAVRTVPGLVELARGSVSVSDLRELDIEDLLGREIVAPNAALLASKITDKVVLVTGAGGSIGSELCRQIVLLRPATLLIIDASEFALYSINRELIDICKQHAIDVSVIETFLTSVLNARSIDALIERFRPDTIYHAAAYKHVPLVEHNPIEGITNNVFGTLIIARAAEQHCVKDVVLISTDKAVRPTNVMGATKRLAELVLQGLAEEDSATCFSMVRFGNVLGSSGSVVPLFRDQLKRGGPITITHTDITRYFMAISEAAELVIQAGAMAAGGEVFVLDMGAPVRIFDLARNMVILSGLTVRSEDKPDGDIEIQVVGLRPGEKLYEELLIDDRAEKTHHPRIMKANEPSLPWDQLKSELDELHHALDNYDLAAAIEKLIKLVPEFKPQPMNEVPALCIE